MLAQLYKTIGPYTQSTASIRLSCVLHVCLLRNMFLTDTLQLDGLDVPSLLDGFDIRGTNTNDLDIGSSA